MMTVVGVDASKAGWVFVRLEAGAFAAADLYADFAAGVTAAADADVIGVDMPIGLPTGRAPRAADGAARALLRGRTSTVFSVPPEPVLAAATYDEANHRSRALTGRGSSRQSYAIAPKVREVAPIAAADPRVYEVHPEVSFRALADHPLAASKHSWAGQVARRALLTEAGIVLPDDLGAAGVAAPDDILDAAVVAWTATRITAGTAESLPAPPERDAAGRPMAIWY